MGLVKMESTLKKAFRRLFLSFFEIFVAMSSSSSASSVMRGGFRSRHILRLMNTGKRVLPMIQLANCSELETLVSMVTTRKGASTMMIHFSKYETRPTAHSVLTASTSTVKSLNTASSASTSSGHSMEKFAKMALTCRKLTEIEIAAQLKPILDRTTSSPPMMMNAMMPRMTISGLNPPWHAVHLPPWRKYRPPPVKHVSHPTPAAPSAYVQYFSSH
mmetsp:Transcript_47595/g.114214  ORF Transcript_47595/g.114214 Transcript_47595/m.114214 type:complete len:217 (-) Transcript_47595:2412-3062(-)